MSYNGLKDKLLEFRNMDTSPFNLYILDGDRRAQVEKQMKKDILQTRFNIIQQRGFTTLDSIGPDQQQQYDCYLLDRFKSDITRRKANNESEAIDECLAGQLRNELDDRNKQHEKRIILRNTQPELRELGKKIMERINGHHMISQMEYKERRRRELAELELAQEQEIMGIDNRRMEEKQKSIRDNSEKHKNELKKALEEHLSASNSKLQRVREEREQNKRIIDNLVQQEQKKIAAEQEMENRRREGLKKEYEAFMERLDDEKLQSKEAERLHVEKLMREQEHIRNRRDNEEARKQSKVQQMIQRQESVGVLTNGLAQAKEKELRGYLEANEMIALAENKLTEYNLAETMSAEKSKSAQAERDQLDKLAAFKREERKKELAKEREMDDFNMARLAKEAKERETENKLKKAKLNAEISEYMTKRQEMLAAEIAREKREAEEEKAARNAFDELVRAEREAMLAEYAEIMNNYAECQRTNT